MPANELHLVEGSTPTRTLTITNDNGSTPDLTTATACTVKLWDPDNKTAPVASIAGTNLTNVGTLDVNLSTLTALTIPDGQVRRYHLSVSWTIAGVTEVAPSKHQPPFRVYVRAAF